MLQVLNVTKYSMLQSTQCYKVLNVTKYLITKYYIFQSTKSYKLLNVTNVEKC